MKTLSLVFVSFALVSANTALADNKQTVHSETKVEQGGDGTYKAKTTSETVDASGTKTEYERDEQAKNKLLGGTEVSTKESVKTDPKGMLNSTTETREVTTSTDRKGDYKHTREADSVDSAGTAHKHKVVQEVSKNGNKVETTETRVDDPKGLMNKKTTEASSTVETNKDGSINSEYSEKVNGKVVHSDK